MARLFRAFLLASLALPALAVPAVAQESTPQAAEPDTTIVVTGTRRTDRTLADSPVPVDVIGADVIANAGQAETNKLLNALVPSFNFPQPSIADGTDAIKPASLRGLAPDQTLVLVNGKRRHVSALLNVNGTIGRGSAAVDLNLIPGLAIDRIEVLRDGASSQYGSDAIAGVINIRLKTASEGGRATASYGKYVTTLDNVRNITGLVLDPAGQPGFDPADPGRVFAATSNGERKARDGELITFGTNFGLPIGEGYLNITAEYRDRSPTNRAGYDLRPNYNRPTAAFDPREVNFNRLQFRYGDNKANDYAFFVNYGQPLGDLFEAYAFGSYGLRDSISAANWRQQSAAANRDFETITPATTPSAANFTPLTPDGFLPLIETELEDYAGTLGVRGEVGGFNADLSVQYGRSRFDYAVRGTLNTSFGRASQSGFDAGGLRYGQLVANLDFSREFDMGFAKPVSLAVGFEYRDENFVVRAGDFQSYATGPLFRPSITTTAANCAAQVGVFNATTGVCSFPGRAAPAGAQGFPGIPASAGTDANRHSFAAYWEADTDIFEGFTATLAGRYENFSDFGGTYNGKIALRFEPVDGYALRGSVSNGFRAPSLHQQFFQTTSTNFILGLPVDISTLPVASPVARALGSRDLEPEKSLNFSVGGTANPFRGFTLTADYYNIRIRNRIVLTENLGAAGSGTAAVNAAVKAILDANGFQSVGAARFFINGLDTTTEGFDIVGSYRTNFAEGGAVTLTAAYNNNKTRIDRRINALGPLATIPGIVLFGRIEGIRFTDGQPRDKIVLSADANYRALGLTARTTRYGRVISPEGTPLAPNAASLTASAPDDIVLGAKWITDLEVRLKPVPSVEVAVGANNLFDVYPDRSPFGVRPASAGGGQYPINRYYLPYSGFSPFGFNGRFLYGRVAFSF